MALRVLILIVLSFSLVSLRPHSFTDRPQQNDRPMAFADNRDDTLSCSQDFCQDFEYTGGCGSEHGWPYTTKFSATSGANCNWDGDGVTSGTNALHYDAAGEYIRHWSVIDVSGTGILYSQFSIRVISASNTFFEQAWVARTLIDPIYPQFKIKGSTTHFQLWCDIVGSSVSSTYTYSTGTDYVIRVKTDSNHPVTQQAQIYNTSMTLLDTLTCSSGASQDSPTGFAAGAYSNSIGEGVIDDIQLSTDAF